MYDRRVDRPIVLEELEVEEAEIPVPEIELNADDNGEILEYEEFDIVSEELDPDEAIERILSHPEINLNTDRGLA